MRGDWPRSTTQLREVGGSADSSSPRASAAPSTTGTVIPTGFASATPGQFPSADELPLLTLLDEQARTRCQRADPEDAPVYSAEEPAARTVLRTDAGIDCALGGISAPDRVWVWELSEQQRSGTYSDPRTGVDADGQVIYRATRVGAAGASCETQVPAHEEWSKEGRSGRLVCYETATGDAVIEWAVEGTRLLGKALRDDRDMPALLRWWNEHARSADSASIPSPSSAGTEGTLDPEWEAAFVAGLEARDSEPFTYLDPALFACETIVQFSAASKAYPDALDIPMTAFLSNRGQANEGHLATPLCSAVNPHD